MIKLFVRLKFLKIKNIKLQSNFYRVGRDIVFSKELIKKLNLNDFLFGETFSVKINYIN